MENKTPSLGTLYIVATPIGNLDDITLRAIKILSEVDIVLAEDTRVTQKLLSFIFSNRSQSLDRKPRLISYHQHTGESHKLEILKLLQEGKNMALVTDAGTPGISDPGNELIDFILSFQPDLKVVPIVGASAVTAALSVCGFNISRFSFVGFVPKKKGRKLLEDSLKLRVPVVFFESPYRIFKTLTKLSDLPHPPRRVFVGQELTKLHERYIRGSVKEVVEELEKEESNLGRIKGEIVVILEP